MTTEEKKAIDDLFALTHINGYIDLYTKKEAKINTLALSKWQNGVKVILNLIKKQSKEIEELKKAQRFKKINNTKYWVHKDKIREKARELTAMSISSDLYYEYIYKMFEELLEE